MKSIAITATNDLAAASVDRSRETDQAPIDPAQRLAQWISSLAPTTQRAYRSDLSSFSLWLGEPGIGTMLDRLIACRPARALELVESFRDAERKRGCGTAVVNRRLAAINGALRALGRAEIGPGRLDLEFLANEPRKDTRGPGAVKVAAVLEALAPRRDPLAIRDLAMIRLMSQRGLRRNEVASLRIEDVDLDRGEARLLRKGHRERVTVSLPAGCTLAIRAWLTIRDRFASADEVTLFVGCGNRSRGRPITGGLLFEVVRRNSAKVGGGGWRPHGLRHTAISAVLARTGNLAAAQVFAGHRSPAVTSRYLDDKGSLERGAVSEMEALFT